MVKRKENSPVLRKLLCGTAALVLVAVPAMGQETRVTRTDCDLVGGVLPADCARMNAGTSVDMPTGESTEWDRDTVVTPEGFQFVIDGKPVTGDPRVEDVVRRTDLALEAADVQLKFDGLGASPRLDLQRDQAEEALEPGDQVTFRSRLNYPGYVTRGEVRILDMAATGGPRTVAVVPIDPNGSATVMLPDGERLMAVHRVYDAKGRYDETVLLPLSMPDRRGLSETEEEGTDATARRRIPVRGGAVTVAGKGIAPGATVYTLGEAVHPDAKGNFVLQRILPTGPHAVDVEVAGAGRPLRFTRELEIPKTDFFYHVLADATIGHRDTPGADKTYTDGRLAFYLDGYTDRGVQITASADSRENDIEDLFRSFDEKDPSSLLRRIDPKEVYPVYGDDSSLVENAPTQGKFYLKLEKDRNYIVWGNSQAELSNSEYLRNERTLYGVNAHAETQEQTSFGEARATVTLYGAQPDNLPQRDIFRGTGGSLYFLSRQDISRGSEFVTVEVRDATTGRVIDRRQLISGTDYDVNYMQGTVQLNRPLSASAGSGVVVTSPGGQNNVYLIVQYEYTPTSGQLDGMSVGGRVEGWVTDALRLGVSAQKEDTGPADQTAYGVDLRYRLGEESHIDLEYAESDGPGFGNRVSTDGGLIFNSNGAPGGKGRAYRFETELDLAEIGAGVNGTVSAYYEDRSAGFSTLDYSATSDENLYGFEAEVEASDQLTWSAYYDNYDNVAGAESTEGGVELTYTPDKVNEWQLGIEHVKRVSVTENGDRTDVALRYERHVTEDFSWSVLAQGTAAKSGTISRNNRFGVGMSKDFGNGWTLDGEISDGSLGFGADILASYEKEKNASLYFGYELDPDAFDRSATGYGDNEGKFVFGGRRKVSDAVSMYAENTYDVFGRHNSLTSAYGVDYAPTDYLTYTIGLDVGRIADDVNGDFDRHALSLGVEYDDDALTAAGKIELRRERGTAASTTQPDADTFLLTATANWKIDDSHRFLFDLDYADTDTDQSSIRNGRLTDITLGYAIRPVTNDRFNMLLKYRYLYDMYGQVIDGSAAPGPRQKSHVFTVDAEYDLNEHWSLGGKVGGRLSESAATTTSAFYQNDAYLAVMNTRFHVVHNWDFLLEGRALRLEQAQTTDYGALAAIYRHFGNNFEAGLGYNFGRFSDDLTDMTQDDKGVFLNFIGKF